MGLNMRMDSCIGWLSHDTLHACHTTSWMQQISYSFLRLARSSQLLCTQHGKVSRNQVFYAAGLHEIVGNCHESTVR